MNQYGPPYSSGLGQTVEKPRVQPGKTVPSEFPRLQPKGTPEGPFSQAARGFSTVSQALFTPVGQSWTFKNLKSLKVRPKVAFRLSVRSSLNIF